MRLNYIFKYIGLVLVLMSAFMMIAAGVAAESGETNTMMSLLLSGILVGVLGAYPQIFVHTKSGLTRQESYVVVVGAWASACLCGAMPYLMYGGEFSIVDSLFESISGFTTTGASVLDDIEALPQGILFWRMSTAWIGGIGIVVMFSLLIPESRGDGSLLRGVEVSDIARDAAGMKSKNFVHSMLLVYVCLTVITTLALKLCGMRWFDALTHAMSCCSTCGFSTKNASIAAFDSLPVEIVTIISIVVSSLRFSFIYTAFVSLLPRRDCVLHHRSSLFRSEVTKAFLALSSVALVLILADMLLHGTYSSFGKALRVASFQVASLVTTTGFATADTNVWPSLSITILLLCSVVCGCTGSTSGGMKVDRLVLLAKVVHKKFSLLQNPNLLKCIRVDDRVVKDNIISDALIFAILYFSAIALGSLLNVGCGMDLRSGISAAVACIGNVGPGFGSVGSMSNYSDLPMLVKMSSMALMLLGRLEIFPIVAIFFKAHR